VIAWRAGSAIPGMFAHALNNGIAVLLVRGELPFLSSSDDSGLLDRQPAIGLAVAGVLVAAGMMLAVTGDRAA
jgi:hypothetical protein